MILVSDVFKSVGTPTHTYVEQDNGFYERNLRANFRFEGTVSLLTGPSKTGKTSLYKKVLSDLGAEPLIVRCDNEVSSVEFWKKALEKVNFERASSRELLRGTSMNASVKGGVEFGWKWLAKVLGEVNFGIVKDKSDTEIREVILSNPSPEHLIPILKELNFFLVAEDFHYLKPDVQRTLFQQWKTFVDNEISTLIVGTTHHSIDIPIANQDLNGRLVHIEMGMWKSEDLIQIIDKGFKVLNIDIDNKIKEIIINEAIGLPLIVQSVCLQYFIDKDVEEVNNESKRLDVSPTEISIIETLHNVARLRFNIYSNFFKILSGGLRTNKYDTYRIVLLTFSVDPPRFSLSRAEIDTRIKKLLINDLNRVPPKNSINSMLKSLSQLQNKYGIELLEWHPIQNEIFILEPAFLFYIRWHEKRKISKIDFVSLDLKDFRSSILENIKIILFAGHGESSVSKDNDSTTNDGDVEFEEVPN